MGTFNVDLSTHVAVPRKPLRSASLHCFMQQGDTMLYVAGKRVVYVASMRF